MDVKKNIVEAIQEEANKPYVSHIFVHIDDLVAYSKSFWAENSSHPWKGQMVRKILRGNDTVYIQADKSIKKRGEIKSLHSYA